MLHRGEGESEAVLDADVVVIGYGPVGATAANLLGARGLEVVVLERDPSPYARARAISTDEEVLRIWQGAGLAERLKRDMLGERPIDYVDAKGRSFLSLDLASRGNGQPPQMFIYQPELEAVLREGVGRFPNVTVLLEHEMQTVSHDGDGVDVTARDLRTGAPSRVRAAFAIACDGGSSPTRTQLGIGFEGETFEDPWLVIDTKVKREWPEVDRLRFHCDPERPSVDCPTPLGHHRWEFPVLPGEDRDTLASEESVWALIGRYGVGPENVEILRSVVYVHHVRFASRWRQGRVFLAGDAAHVMPPWIGQGMAAGVRDVGNLAWKLAAVVDGRAGESLLDTYETERQPHVRAVTNKALMFGRIITERRRILAGLRNVVLGAMKRIPGADAYLRRGSWFPAARFEDGFKAALGNAKAAGILMPQPICRTEAGAEVLLDDLLGEGWGLITLAGEPSPASEAVAAWAELGARRLELLRAGTPGPGQVVDAEGLLVDWMAKRGATALVVRPDRFVFAAAGGKHPLPPPPPSLHPIRKAVTA